MFFRHTVPTVPPDRSEQTPIQKELPLLKAKKRDPEALSVIYRHFITAIYSYVAARVVDRTTAEDLTSEVFLKMVEGIQQVKATNEASFAAWLFQIARITVADHYRKQSKQPLFLSLDLEKLENNDTSTSALLAIHPDSDPVYWSEIRSEWQDVVEAINKLTEEQRQVLISRFILGYDLATVAQMLGKNVNAIKALQFRALQTLHRLLTLASEGARNREALNHLHQPTGRSNHNEAPC